MRFRKVFLDCAVAVILVGFVLGDLAFSADKASADKSSKVSPGESAKPTVFDRSRTLGGVAPAKSDTLVTQYLNDPDTINPIIAHDSVSRDFLRWVYEPLAQQSFKDPDIFEPALAESGTFDKKNLLFTIKLRKGVKWHPVKLSSGKLLSAKKFTARDVKFTFDCLLNPNIQAASLRSYFEDPDAKDASQKYKIKDAS
jgi:ABC-type transport system substrate-binding protein